MKIGEVFGIDIVTPSGIVRSHKLLKSISTSGKSLFINLEVTALDLPVEFEVLITYKKINFDCQTWLDPKNNILMSPNHPNKTNCSWLITSNFGSYIILNFKFIEVISYS